MIKVKYERYWNDYHRKNEIIGLYSLSQLENWIFDQMQLDYTKDRWCLSFPTLEAAKRINTEGPWDIRFNPTRYSESIWIHLIEKDGRIVFSDGKFTAGQRHWSEEVKEWLTHCEERRKCPKFNFGK